MAIWYIANDTSKKLIGWTEADSEPTPPTGHTIIAKTVLEGIAPNEPEYLDGTVDDVDPPTTFTASANAPPDPDTDEGAKLIAAERFVAWARNWWDYMEETRYLWTDAENTRLHSYGHFIFVNTIRVVLSTDRTDGEKEKILDSVRSMPSDIDGIPALVAGIVGLTADATKDTLWSSVDADPVAETTLANAADTLNDTTDIVSAVTPAKLHGGAWIDDI